MAGKSLETLLSETRQVIGQPDSANSQFTDAQLTVWLNDGYRRVLMLLESFPKTLTDYAPTSRTVTLSSGTIRVDLAKWLDASNTTYSEMEIITLDELFTRFPDWENEDSGVPKYFVRTGVLSAIIHPAPNSTQSGSTLRTYGLVNPTAMSATTDTPSSLTDNLSDILPHWAAHRAFMFMERREDSTQQLILFNQGVKSQKMISSGTSRKGSRWHFGDFDD